MARFYVAIPSYKRAIDAGMVVPLVMMTRGGHSLAFGGIDTSACTLRFNQMLIDAKEMHARGECDFFLLWHSDVVPEAYFLDKLVEVQKRTGAEILSAVIPIKDGRGLTSTALDEEAGDVPKEWSPRRLTMAEVFKLPETFTDEKILLNTGLMLLDLSAPWLDLEKIHFRIDDSIIRHAGRLMAVFKPEDWNFSRDARALGCTKQFATREVKLTHFGEAGYTNAQVWGTQVHDDRKVIPPDIAEAINEASKIQGWMTPEELEYLAGAAKGNKTVVEIGSWKGRSTKAMAMTCTGRIFACDHWRGSSNGDLTGLEADQRGEAAIREEFDRNVAARHPNVVAVAEHHALLGERLAAEAGKVDFAFIDGDHAYEHIRRDILTALDLMAPGAVLAGHDMNEAGVAKAVGELLPGAKVVTGSIWEYRVPTIAPNAIAGSSLATATASSSADVPSETTGGFRLV